MTKPTKINAAAMARAHSTAELRALAYDARLCCRWAEAAELYEAAVLAYPRTTGSLAAIDTAQLAQAAADCRNAAEMETDR